MKKVFFGLITLSILFGCYLPNDNINPTKFHFYVNGRLENIEDSFFQSNFDFKEVNYKNNWTMKPLFNLTLKQNDTTINYEMRLTDCQNFHSLINYNEEIKNCNQTFIGIRNFSSNYDSITDLKAKEIFKSNFIDKLNELVAEEKLDYHVGIDRISEDSIVVNVLDKNDSIRKQRIFINHNLDERINDSLSKQYMQIKIIDNRDSSTVIYHYNKKQHYMYIESKKTMPNNMYN